MHTNQNCRPIPSGSSTNSLCAVRIAAKKHYENLNDNPDPELLGHLLSVVPEIAKIKGVYDSGYRVNINTGEDSASTVPHLHLHIMGGIKMGRATFEESFRLEENAE